MDSKCQGKTGETLLVALSVLAWVVIGFLLSSWFVQLLWNWVVPEIWPGMSKITYLQALGLYVLSALLFKSYCWPSSNPNKSF